MKKYKVIFEIHVDVKRKIVREIEVEAGNKKTASIRAMGELAKDRSMSGYFKNIVSVEEVF